MSRCLMPGCTAEAKPKGDYCKDAHRASAHKLRVKSGGMLPRERKRLHDAAAKRVARSQGTIPSDVRLSYGRAAEVLGAWFAECLPESEWEHFGSPEALARTVLLDALPESKQGAS